MSQKKSFIVAWFKNGQLYRARACRGKIKNRVANLWNEYAQQWNRFSNDQINLVVVANGEDFLQIAAEHLGLPTHAKKEDLQKAKMLRRLFNLPASKTVN